MDLIKEIEEFKKIWKNRSLIGKIFLSITFALSALSVGSLADTVFAFKGFVVEAIGFYKDITEPIRNQISQIFSIKISRFALDVVVLVFMTWGAQIKADHSNDQIQGFFSYCLGLGLLSVVGYSIGYFLAPTTDHSAALSLLFFLFLPLLIAVTINKNSRIYKSDRQVFFYIFTIYFFVALIAAISSGLTRPLSS